MLKMNSGEAVRGFRGDYAFLSNFYHGTFSAGGRIFPTVEHAFQFYKTEDVWWQEKILEAESPKEAKAIGKRCPMREDWDEIKVDLMLALVWQKFSDNEILKEKLVELDASYIEETNTWGDQFWGVCDGIGQNVLGKILMVVRLQLQMGEILGKACELL